MNAAESSAATFSQIIAEACKQPVAQAVGWQCEAQLDASGPWLLVRHPRARVRNQGWKLHVSTNILYASQTLRRVLPVLLAEPVAFKVTASTDILDALNSGKWFSQVGKFITVYPSDDSQAVRFAVALDEATRGLPGPDIPSDRPLRPGSRVHYRYGGFGGLTIQTRLGEILPALRTPSGELVPDLRGTTYQPPDWAVDPFLEAGVAVELPTPNPLVGERYLIVAVLYRSAQSAVYLAVDLVHARRCVLKQAATEGQMGAVGREHGNRLRHEAEILERLAPDPCFPAVLDLIEQGDSLYLVMEHLAGETLEQHVVGLAVMGRTVPGPRVVAWGRELAAMLAKVHAAGLVYRDLKSANVLVTPTGSLRLIDFDVACEQGHAGFPGIGTRGYISPHQDSGASAAVSDDIYSLGALLAYMTTAAEPSQAPHPFDLLDRPLSVLNPGTNPALANVIARCLAPDPAARFPTMAAVDAALIAARKSVAIAAPPYGSESVSSREDEEQARSRCRNLARRLGDTLCAVAERLPNGFGLCWVSSHPLTAGMRTRDLNTGAAGTLLALSELVTEFDDPMHRTVLAEGACWLENAPRPGGEPLPGLYVGEAGVGAALLRAGQVMGDQALIKAAAARGDWIATMPYSSPDLFNGTAGRLRFHLLLWEETAAPEHLAHAVAAGEALLATVEAAEKGRRRWVIPHGYGSLSGRAYLGYAHGAAGIADALLDLLEATGDERFLKPVRGAGRWLAHLATPALDDGSGLNWPSTEDQQPAAAYWCHGAAGVGRFFLHAATLGLLPEAMDLTMRSLRTVARGARWAGPTQCHGLAGNIEVLLDAYQATCEDTHLTEARSLSRLLEAFALDRDGLLVWKSDHPEIVTPDYMVGYAGVAVTLLRLADPEHRPHGISRRGFRYPA